MFINKDFSDDCRSMSIETLDTQCDDIFEIEDYQVRVKATRLSETLER